MSAPNSLESPSPGYARQLLDNLAKLWAETCFCDVTLLIGTKRFKAHKNILAASSSFFRAMFSSGMEEQNRHEIELHDVSSDVFYTIISFIYTGVVKVDIDTCQDILAVADMLGLEGVVDICSQFLLEHISPQNCVGIYVFADAHSLASLRRQAEMYLEKHFLQASQGEEFLQLPLEMLLPLFGSERLHIDRESQVLQAAVDWVVSDLPLRRRHLLQVLSQVRINLVSSKNFLKVLNRCSDLGLQSTLKRYALAPETVKSFSQYNTYLPVSSTLPCTPTWPRKNAKKYIYVIGGFARDRLSFLSSISTLDSVERYDVYSQKWQVLAGMRHARSSHGLTVLDRKIVAAGGEDASLISDSVECFDPDENLWTSLPSMQQPRYGLSMVSLNCFLYAIGGYVGTQMGTSVERFDPRDRTWVEMDTMPNPRFSMAAVEYEGLIYIAGGLTELYTESDTVESYNPVTKEWFTLSKLKFPRAYHGLVAHEGYLYAVGGFNEYRGSLSSVEKYSIKENTWVNVAPMNVSRAGAGVALVDGKIFVFGGRSQDVELTAGHGFSTSATLDSVEVYDPDSDTWSGLPRMTYERCETVAVVL